MQYLIFWLRCFMSSSVTSKLNCFTYIYLNRIVVKIQDFTGLHRYFLWNCLNTGSRKMVSFPCNNTETKNRNDLNHTCRVVDPRNWVPNSKYCKTLQLLVCLIKPLFLVQVFSYGSFFFYFICAHIFAMMMGKINTLLELLIIEFLNIFTGIVYICISRS